MKKVFPSKTDNIDVSLSEGQSDNSQSKGKGERFGLGD